MSADGSRNPGRVVAGLRQQVKLQRQRVRAGAVLAVLGFVAGTSVFVRVIPLWLTVSAGITCVTAGFAATMDWKLLRKKTESLKRAEEAAGQ